MKIIIILLFLTTCAALATPVIDLTLTAPDSNITGLGYGDGYLWAVDRSSKYIYKLNPTTGNVEDSWLCSQVGARTPTGLTVLSNYVFVAAASGSNLVDPYCYKYSTGGAYVSAFDLDC